MSKSVRKNLNAKQTIRLLWSHARRYPGYAYPIFGVVPVTVLVGNFVRPYIMAEILQRLSSGTYDHQHILSSFAGLLVQYGLATVLFGVVGWRLVIWLEWNLALNVVRDVNQRVFGHLLDMSMTFHSNRFVGSLVSQTNKLSGAYLRLSDATVYSVLPLITSLAATALILAPRAPVYVALLLVISAVYLAGTVYFSRGVRVANAAEAALESRQTGMLADAVTNVVAVKTFAAHAAERDRFWRGASEVRAAGRTSMSATMKRQNYAAIMTQTLSVLALVVAVVSVGVWHANIATVFLIVSYTGSLLDQLWNFQNVLKQYNRAFGDASDMVAILQIEPGIKDPASPEASLIQAGAIKFEHMTFTHGDNTETLFKDFNLDIKPGEKIGLVGQSGSGKTTLTRLLLRFSDLDSGQIAMDGQDIRNITQDDLRRAISYVPQEPLLFHRTLSENISYGKPGATEAEIVEAARRAHADEFIQHLPHGYETLVGERGIKLSGGQRQRIAIARAMIKDAPILVLDEATSALDSESERLIQDALWSLMEGRTAIVIAHRLSTIAHMDRIVVMASGAIVEQGSHAQLLKRHGVYAGLWAHQSGGFMAE